MDSLIQYWRINSHYVPYILLLIGLLVVLAAVAYAHLQRKSKMRARQAVLNCIICIFLLAIVATTLLPTNNPNHVYSLQIQFDKLLLSDMESVINFLLMIPLTVTVLMRTRHRYKLTLLLVTQLSIMIEAMQFILPIGRIASINDFLLNTMGCVLAAFIYWLCSRPQERRSN